MKDLASSYARHSRTGVAQVSETVEVYFVAQCALAAKLLQAAAMMDTNITGKVSLLPAHVTDEQFLMVIIHRKVCIAAFAPPLNDFGGHGIDGNHTHVPIHAEIE